MNIAKVFVKLTCKRLQYVINELISVCAYFSVLNFINTSYQEFLYISVLNLFDLLLQDISFW